MKSIFFVTCLCLLVSPVYAQDWQQEERDKKAAYHQQAYDDIELEQQKMEDRRTQRLQDGEIQQQQEGMEAQKLKIIQQQQEIEALKQQIQQQQQEINNYDSLTLATAPSAPTPMTHLAAEQGKKVTTKIKQNAESRQKIALKDSWLDGDKLDIFGFADFGDLAKIITDNWDDFQDIIPTQAWLTQRMTELEKARHFVAHNRLLQPTEFQRIYMYVSDWNKVIGI